MKYLLNSIFFLISFCVFAQSGNDKMIFLDSLKMPTTQGNHIYYRVVRDYYTEKENYLVQDYYKSGQLQMEGNSPVKEYLQETGEVTFYYENGNKKSVSNYRKSRPYGRYLCWYENGKPRMEGEYPEDEKSLIPELRVKEFWNSSNEHTIVDGNGDFEDLTDTEYCKGKIKDGYKEGVWTGEDRNSHFTYTETYKDKKLVSGISIDENREQHTYTQVDVKPKPRKGYENFYKYIGKKFRVPDVAGLSGRILTRFVVDKDGKVIDPVVITSIGYGTDEEAIRVITNYEGWEPGELRGIKVKVSFTIPINIQSPN